MKENSNTGWDDLIMMSETAPALDELSNAAWTTANKTSFDDLASIDVPKQPYERVITMLEVPCSTCGLRWEVVRTEHDLTEMGTRFTLAHNGDAKCDYILPDRMSHGDDRTIREWVDDVLTDTAKNGCNVMEDLLPMDELFEMLPVVA